MNTQPTELQQLQEQYNAKYRELKQIGNRIEELETESELPGLKQKYEGKFFKCRNSYSCPETDADYWYLYTCVEEVQDTSGFHGWSFQTDKYGKISIEIRENIYESSLEQEITKEEFETAYHKMLGSIPTVAQRQRSVATAADKRTEP